MSSNPGCRREEEVVGEFNMEGAHLATFKTAIEAIFMAQEMNEK